METIRTKLSRKRRKLVFTMLFGFLILVAGMIGIIVNEWFWILFIAGGLIIVYANSVLWFIFPCPVCGANLGGAINTPVRWWKIEWKLGISDQIKFCQCCGVSLDKEIEH
jgi:hypothetical protein